MHDCATEEIEMYQHVEEVEAPTNGLDEFVEWDALEEGLSEGKFDSQAGFRAELARQFEGAGVAFTRGFYRAAIKGMFREFRDLYRALPANPTIMKEVA